MHITSHVASSFGIYICIEYMHTVDIIYFNDVLVLFQSPFRFQVLFNNDSLKTI